MNNNYRTINKYEGLSLVEMLITLLIVGLVLLVVSTTLTALIKASAISSARTLVRDDTEYIFEILERYVQNSQIDEIFLYKVQSGINTNWGFLRKVLSPHLLGKPYKYMISQMIL